MSTSKNKQALKEQENKIPVVKSRSSSGIRKPEKVTTPKASGSGRKTRSTTRKAQDQADDPEIVMVVSDNEYQSESSDETAVKSRNSRKSTQEQKRAQALKDKLDHERKRMELRLEEQRKKVELKQQLFAYQVKPKGIEEQAGVSLKLAFESFKVHRSIANKLTKEAEKSAQ